MRKGFICHLRIRKKAKRLSRKCSFPRFSFVRHFPLPSDEMLIFWHAFNSTVLRFSGIYIFFYSFLPDWEQNFHFKTYIFQIKIIWEKRIFCLCKYLTMCKWERHHRKCNGKFLWSNFFDRVKWKLWCLAFLLRCIKTFL
jgi:hypothetical protein